MQISNNLRQPRTWLGLLLATAVVGSNLVAEDSSKQKLVSADSMGGVQAPALSQMRLREGTQIEARLCNCRATGEQLVLSIKDEGRSMLALENLAAQRVLKSIMDDPSDGDWIISGVVTEFQGNNYLLIERAVRPSKR